MVMLFPNFTHPSSNQVYQYGICTFQFANFLQKNHHFNLFHSPIKGKSSFFYIFVSATTKINYSNYANFAFV